MHIEESHLAEYSAREREAEAREREHASLSCDACGKAGSPTHTLTPCANVECDRYINEDCVDADSIEAALGVCTDARCAVIAVHDLREMLRLAERRAA